LHRHLSEGPFLVVLDNVLEPTAGASPPSLDQLFPGRARPAVGRGRDLVGGQRQLRHPGRRDVVEEAFAEVLALVGEP